MENLKNVRVDGETVDADAGVTLSKIAFEAYTKSLTGFEFAQGIPGTLGGGVYMNAGAYGSEMKDVIESVTAYSKDKGIVTFSNDECCFGYRKSVFTDSDYVILRAKIKLKIGNKDEIKSQMDTLSDKRRKSQPLELPSAGSTFKRPQTGYAAAMIDAAGLKGFSVGGAQVSEKHGGFVVNKGGATFDDFMAVVRHVQETVYKDTGVMLEPEVKIIH
jgi:UDP-N-acetylmuramate dehydrogenase